MSAVRRTLAQVMGQDGGAAEFRMSNETIARAMWAVAALLAMFAVVLLLLGSLGGLWVGVLVSGLGTLAAYLVLRYKVRRAVAANVLRLDGSGIRWNSGGGVVHTVAWSDLTGIGPVDVQLTPRRRLRGGPGLIAGRVQDRVRGRLQDRVQDGLVPNRPMPQVVGASLADHGLHGWSTVTLPPRVPSVMRQAVERMPVDEASGKRHVGIPLVTFDRSWPQGPIGGWIRAHRPDLLPD